MAGSQISTSVTIINSLLGYQAVSFSVIDGTLPDIAAGSKVEISSGFFTFDSDETPQASTWTAIGTNSTVYITLTPSGSAGTQIVTAKWTDTDPVWSDSKQGWYATVASTVRYVASAHKADTNVCTFPFILDAVHVGSESIDVYESAVGGGESAQTCLGTGLLSRMVFRIGEWNMDATQTYEFNVGLKYDQVVDVQAFVRRDDASEYRPINGSSADGTSDGIIWLNYDGGAGTGIHLGRVAGARFDAAEYDATASTVAYRGICVVTYIDVDVYNL